MDACLHVYTTRQTSKFKYPKENDMKKLSWFFLIAVVSLGFSSCSDDDDENGGGVSGGSGVKVCYSAIDGTRIDYKYAYLYTMDGVDDYPACELAFTNLDLLYYYKNPDKIKKGLMLSEFIIWFENTYDIPTGEISSYTENDQDGIIFFDIESGTRDLYDVYMNPDDVDPVYKWYGLDSYHNSSLLEVSKSGNTYTMECPRLYLLESNEDDGTIGYESKQVMGKFYFQGSVLNMSDMMQGEPMKEPGEVCLQVIEVKDPGFKNWLKHIRRYNNR